MPGPGRTASPLADPGRKTCRPLVAGVTSRRGGRSVEPHDGLTSAAAPRRGRRTVCEPTGAWTPVAATGARARIAAAAGARAREPVVPARRRDGRGSRRRGRGSRRRGRGKRGARHAGPPHRGDCRAKAAEVGAWRRTDQVDRFFAKPSGSVGEGEASARPTVVAPAITPAGTTRPRACPPTAPAELPAPRWRAAHAELAPPGASAIRLCRYSGLNAHPRLRLTRMRLLTAPPTVRRTVADLGRLPAGPTGAVACPSDDGSQILARLAYPDGHALTISVALSGCGPVTNGSIRRTAAAIGVAPHPRPRLIAELERALSGRSTRAVAGAPAPPSPEHQAPPSSPAGLLTATATAPRTPRAWSGSARSRRR